jgi:hypothetical protein
MARLKQGVERINYKLAGRRFQAREAATDKAFSPSFSRVLGLTKSPCDAFRSADRDGTTATAASRSVT